MKTYKIFLSKTFENKLRKKEKSFKHWLERTIIQLAANPFVGKPLKVKWFREKKFKKQRIYFLIYENFGMVYVVNLSEKKDQQKVINSIKLLLDVYEKEAKDLVK